MTGRRWFGSRVSPAPAWRPDRSTRPQPSRPRLAHSVLGELLRDLLRVSDQLGRRAPARLPDLCVGRVLNNLDLEHVPTLRRGSTEKEPATSGNGCTA